MKRPLFGTAVPRRRYQVGEYTAVVLGDVESQDDIEYKYVLAMIIEGAAHPKLYITLERNRGDAVKAGPHCMRVLGEGVDHVMGSSSDWKSADAFAATALAVAMKILGLTDEQPVPLM